MYVDRRMKEVELLQPIARVNRTAPRKSAGFVVDHTAISKDLDDAMAVMVRNPCSTSTVVSRYLDAGWRRFATAGATKCSTDDLDVAPPGPAPLTCSGDTIQKANENE